MYIESLTLRGIKSYRNEITLHFKEGINFIAGRNGAGKTTIIESIGYLLFWIRPYQYKDLLSTGGKEGFLSVRFRGNDERMYCISREIRKDKCKYVQLEDLQTGAIIEGEDIVREKIFEIHALYSLEHLEELFQEVVAVTQGKFTAPFLENGMEKKRKFQRMFGLETYEEAYKLSSPLPALIKEQIHESATVISHMEGQLIQLPLLREEEEKLLTMKKSLEKKLQQTSTLYKTTSEHYKTQKDTFELLQKTEKDLLNLRNTYDLERQKKETVEKDLKQSQEAAAFCATHKDTYLSYLEKEKKRDSITQELHILEKSQILLQEIEKEESRFSAERKNIRERHEAIEKDTVTFAPSIAEYSTIQKNITALEGEREATKEKQKMLADFEGQITTLEKQIFLQTRQEEEKIMIEKKLLEFQEQMKKLGDLSHRKQELEKQKETYEALQSAYKESETLCSITSSELEKLLLEKNRCDKGSCPTCGTEGDFTVHFDKKEKHLRSTLEQKAQEQKKLEKELSSFSQIKKEEETLIKDSQSHKLLTEQIQALTVSLHSLQAPSIETLFKTMTLPSSLRFPQTTTASSLSHFLEEMVAYKLAQRTLLETEEKSWQEEYEKMRDRLRKSEHAMASQKKISEEKISLEQKAFSIEEASTTLTVKKKTLEKDLLTFSEQKKLLVQIEEDMKSSRTNYQLYITHEKDAQRVTDLEALLESHEHSLQSQKTIGLQAKEAFALLQKDFNKESFEKLQGEVAKIQSELLMCEKDTLRLKQDTEQIQKKCTELMSLQDEMKKNVKEKAQKEKTLRRLDCVRSVFNQAAEPIAAKFRSLLSEKAALFFRRLTQEASMLSWGEDFEVFLVKSEEHTRRFHQLSGGEQMVAALAIRLALMRYVSPFGIGFFDEPTQNLDEAHRRSLGNLLPHVLEGFTQLFLISHDDTFDALTEHVIMLEKTEDGTRLVG